MPTYDYDCAECGHAFEEFQSITATPLEICPQCGGKVQRRINGGAGLIFKGSGFYLTDYKKSAASKDDGSGNSAKKADSDNAKKEGSEKGTSEKPEKKEKSTTE